MKKIVILFLLMSCCFILKAQEPIDCFKVGDVIYSVLEPPKFFQLHEGKWLPLSSRSVSLNKIDNSDLAKQNLDKDGRLKNPFLTIISSNSHTYLNFNLSDAYIRGMNYPNPSGSYSGKDTDPSRKAGEFRQSTIIQHAHELPIKQTSRGLYDVRVNNIITTNPGSGVTTSLEGSGNLIVPKNVTLYIYIKIDE